MALKQTRLRTTLTPGAGASVLTPGTLPAITGEEQENLLCGCCDAVLMKGVGAQTVARNFNAPVQLLMLCPRCKTHNRLPAMAAV